MLTIHKYKLKTTDSQAILSFTGAKFLSAHVQDSADGAGAICIWAEVDDRTAEWYYEVFIYGTGNPRGRTDDMQFLGTVFQRPFVWHVYIKKVI